MDAFGQRVYDELGRWRTRAMAVRLPRSRHAHRARRKREYWSDKVTRASSALDLEPGVFALDDSAAVARSLKRSADASKRRKAEPFRSAMSMLVFYINRAGKNLPKDRLRVLESAKDELRALYRRPRRNG